MNRQRRRELSKIEISINKVIQELKAIKTNLENIKIDEEIAFDNMPENLHYSMRGEEAEEAIENMDDALDSLNEALDSLEDII